MRVVALLAHPDDELMCAGTLARLAADKRNAVIVVTVFVDDERAVALKESCAALNVHSLNVGLDEATFGWDQRTVRQVEGWFSGPPFDLLISHRSADDNTSHEPLARIARTLARKNNVGLWEIDSALPGGIVADAPANNFFVNYAGHVTQKLVAIDAYPMVEAANPGWHDAILDRDRVNGWRIGCEWAEAFRVVKQVWP